MKSTMLIAVLSSVLAFPLVARGQEPGATEGASPQMQQMQSRMQTMQELMERINATEDPAERQRLMQEHMDRMHEGMQMMGEMMRGSMGQGRGQGGRMQPCAENDTECRMNRMQMQQGAMAQRMGMMQQMMQQMMEHMMQHGSPNETSESAVNHEHQ